MIAAVGNKRKRRASSNNITLLSNDLLCSVAEYLPKTSRALLAVSLMQNNEPSTASKAIISSVKDNEPYESLIDDLLSLSEFDPLNIVNFNCQKLVEHKSCRDYKPQLREARYGRNVNTLAMKGRKGLDDQMSKYYNGGWDILDFIDIPKALASRLTDKDLAAILKCIDVKNNLKRLNLTHCFSIVGQGLSPLRGSVVLEKLDLGLVRQMEMPQAFNDIQLSEELVYDILNGILDVEGNTFKRLQVPRVWCTEGANNNPSERLIQFINSHDLAFMNEKNLCAYFGYDNVQSLLGQFHHGGRSDVTDWCSGHCNCKDVNYDGCTHCNKILCHGCGDDMTNCNGDQNGDGCDIVTCYACRDNEAENIVTWCDSDWCEPRCGDCRFRECCNGTLDCNDCKVKVFGRLLEDNNAE